MSKRANATNFSLRCHSWLPSFRASLTDEDPFCAGRNDFSVKRSKITPLHQKHRSCLSHLVSLNATSLNRKIFKAYINLAMLCACHQVSYAMILMVDLYQITPVSVPIVCNNLHVGVSAQVGQIQNQ